LLEQLRQHVERLDLHIVERARQLDRARCTITGARIDEHAGAGRALQLLGEVAPQRGRTQSLMQHDDGRRLVGRWADHAVFELGHADAQKACGRKGHAFFPLVMAGPDPAMA